MKRYLILILAIMVLASGLLVGCDQGTSPRPFPPPETESEEITSATPGCQELPTPKIYEKDIEGIPMLGWLDPELARREKERSFFRFQVEAGNRVEGEVSVWCYNGDGTTTPETSPVVFCIVRDPFGNIILKTKNVEPDNQPWSQEYPWQFAFFAATGGEYSLQVHHRATATVYGAHLKVTVYEE